MQKYSIVEFSEENTVEVILSSWISSNNKTSLWPKNITPSILKRYLKNNTAPSDNWSLVNIRILGYSGIDCYIYFYIPNAGARLCAIRGNSSFDFIKKRSASELTQIKRRVLI